MLVIPVSAVHYYIINKNNINTTVDIDDHEDVL